MPVFLPCRTAYQLHGYGIDMRLGGRQSWDPLIVVAAVRVALRTPAASGGALVVGFLTAAAPSGLHGGARSGRAKR